MDIKLIYILAMLVLASAAFRCTVKVLPNMNDASVEVTGKAQSVVNTDDRKVFNIGDKQLKDAVNKYLGRRPNEVFVKNPTPYGNFQKYDFEEVSKYTYSTRAFVEGVETKPVVVTQQRLRNKTNRNGSYTASIEVRVESTVSTAWSKGGEFTAGVSVEYNVQFVSAGFSMAYSANWGEEKTKTETNIIGSTSSVSIVLGPGETALAKLTATKGTMKVRVKYASFLIGEVWCNYNPTYKGHHFHVVPIFDLVDISGIPSHIISEEVMEIGFYSDADIDLEDLNE